VAPSDPSKTKPLWTLQAHDKAVNAFDVNPIIPGFLVTGSADKQVKLWNITADGPSMVVSRDLGVGQVFATSFAPYAEVGFRLAVAGSKGDVQVWDTSTNAAVRRIFADKVGVPRDGDGEVKERLVGVEEESSDESSEGEEPADGDHDGWEDEDEDDEMED
jgi:periodic tryptophan protein 1